MKDRRPRFYFAFRSPYTWMTARRLEERFPAAHEQFEYIPYFDPDAITLDLLHAQGGDIIYTPMSRAKHLYILQDVKRLATKLGYAMAWPVDIKPWWDLPHLAYLKARRLGRGPEFFRAAYRARFERGDAIYQEDTIRDLAREVDLDPVALLASTADPEIRHEGAQSLLRAHEDGVFGVPFFSMGFEKFWGLDRFDDFAARFSARRQKGEEHGRTPARPSAAGM